MEGREGRPGHNLEYFEMWRARTINDPDAHQIAVSRSSHERARARNAGARQVLSGIDTTRNDTL